MPSSFSVVPNISGTSLACSWPCEPRLVSCSFRKRGLDQLDENTYIVQDKEYLGLNPNQVSTFRMSEGLATTCNGEVAVSVRTPPKAPRWTGRAILEDIREEAGREMRETERANTIMIENYLIEGFERLI